MKKLSLLWIGVFLLLASPGWSQITLNYTDAPSAGLEIIEAEVNPAGVTVGPAGANQTWDFSQLVSVGYDTTQYLEPGGLPFSDAFPEATMAQQDEGGTIYFQITPSQFLVLGGVISFTGNGDYQPVFYDPPAVNFVFPATYETSFTSDFTFELYFVDEEDSLRIKSITSRNSVIDGYGTVITPVKSYDCLRLLSINTSTDSLWTWLEGVDQWQLINTNASTDHNYVWLSKETRGLVVSVDLDPADGEIYHAEYVVGVSSQVLAPEAAFSYTNLGNGRFSFTDASSNQPVSWLWNFGDGSTSTEQNPEHQYTASGTYEVCLTAANSAGTHETCQMVDVIVSSVETLPGGQQLRAFPNPANDWLTLQLNQPLTSPLRLLFVEATGQSLWEFFLRDKLTLETSHWPAGFYFYQIYDGQGRNIGEGQILITH